MADGDAKASKEGGVAAFIGLFIKGRRPWFWGFGAVIVLTATVYDHCDGQCPSPTMLRNAMAGLLVAGAAFAVGGFLGFLFGIPRSLQQDSAAPTDSRFHAVRTNTNLEQISDWLTKIIVGVGLAQAGKIIVMVEGMADRISPLFLATGAPSKAAASLVLALMILFSIIGFLVGYLFARIKLQRMFNDVEWMAQQQPEYFEGMMNAYLYMPPPTGFEKALELRNEYTKRISRNLTDRMWTYTVCALGQQIAYKIEMEKKRLEDLGPEKAALLHALKEALRNDREASSILRPELDPDESRGRVDLFNGDLRSFQNDPDVVKLLRKQPVPEADRDF